MAMAAVLGLASCVTRAVVTRYDAAGNVAMVSRVFTAGDVGAVVASEAHEDKAGLGGLLTGNVGGGGESATEAAELGGSIVAGDVSITGVVVHSAGQREGWSGLNRAVRNVASARVVGEMVRGLVDLTRAREATDAAALRAGTREVEIGAEAAVRQAEILAEGGAE